MVPFPKETRKVLLPFPIETRKVQEQSIKAMRIETRTVLVPVPKMMRMAQEQFIKAMRIETRTVLDKNLIWSQVLKTVLEERRNQQGMGTAFLLQGTTLAAREMKLSG